MRKLIILAIALLLVQPVIALEHIGKDNFAEPEATITPEKSYYLPGEEIKVSYKITPKTEEDMEKIGGEENNPRMYTFETSLTDAKWTIMVNYYLGSWSEEFTGSKVRVNVKFFYLDPERKGVRSIIVNLSGKLPEPEKRLENVVVLNVSVEDCDPGALEEVRVKVVNPDKFPADIADIRKRAEDLKKELEAANASYDKKIFDEISSLIAAAESLVQERKYIEADEKISLAESKLEEVAGESDKLKAEALKEYLSETMKEIGVNISFVEVALKELTSSKNYTALLEKFAELKARYDKLDKSYDEAEKLYEEEKYADAYEKFSEIKDDVENLAKDVSSLRKVVESESKSKPSNLAFNLPLPTFGFGIWIYAAIAAAALVVVGIIVKRRRGKWDELR